MLQSAKADKGGLCSIPTACTCVETQRLQSRRLDVVNVYSLFALTAHVLETMQRSARAVVAHQKAFISIRTTIPMNSRSGRIQQKHLSVHQGPYTLSLATFRWHLLICLYAPHNILQTHDSRTAEHD